MNHRIAPGSVRSNIERCQAILKSLELPLAKDAPTEDIECWDHLDKECLHEFFSGITEAIECLSQTRNRFAYKMVCRIACDNGGDE